jgi:phage N-6-adenine-methyltransferase
MASLEGKFESNRQDWETPQDMFDAINDRFSFTRDVCASPTNKKCEVFFCEENSCLDKEWDGVNWMNPPFKDMKKFVAKAYEQRDNAITVCLLPARTNTRWWHELCMKGEIIFICGRPKFGDNIHGLPQPLALVVFGSGASNFLESFDVKNSSFRG